MAPSMLGFLPDKPHRVHHRVAPWVAHRWSASISSNPHQIVSFDPFKHVAPWSAPQGSLNQNLDATRGLDKSSFQTDFR